MIPYAQKSPCTLSLMYMICALTLKLVESLVTVSPTFLEAWRYPIRYLLVDFCFTPVDNKGTIVPLPNGFQESTLNSLYTAIEVLNLFFKRNRTFLFQEIYKVFYFNNRLLSSQLRYRSPSFNW